VTTDDYSLSVADQLCVDHLIAPYVYTLVYLIFLFFLFVGLLMSFFYIYIIIPVFFIRKWGFLLVRVV